MALLRVQTRKQCRRYNIMQCIGIGGTYIAVIHGCVCVYVCSSRAVIRASDWAGHRCPLSAAVEIESI